ncbi:MAG: hypothetical protein AAFV95_13450 [Bacteroidota bacterium]
MSVLRSFESLHLTWFHHALWLLLLGSLWSCQSESGALPVEVIDSRLRAMEAGIIDQKPEQVAAIYADDGYVLSPNGTLAQGREQLDEYWGGMKGRATHWKLTSLALDRSLKGLTESEAWKKLEYIPPLPSEQGIELDANESYLYQLGRSELTLVRDNSMRVTTVFFLLVWKKVGNDYQIFIDTYRGS